MLDGCGERCRPGDHETGCANGKLTLEEELDLVTQYEHRAWRKWRTAQEDRRQLIELVLLRKKGTE
jgi:hypothetical protein